MNKDEIRKELLRELLVQGVFWSYRNPAPETLSDELLTEKVLLHSDLDSIYKLFEIFPEELIKGVWEERLLPDNSAYSMNLLFALILFNIEKPEEYIHSKAG